jgi:anti-anti-sigma factor
VFGILKGVLLAVIMSLVLLIRRIANPNVAVLGRIGNTNHYSDIERHPDNTTYKGILILRVEASILYFNDAHILEKINEKIEAYADGLRLVILDMSPSSYVDVAGSKMLLQLSNQLHKKNIKLKIVEALSTVREILRKQGMEEVIGHISRRIFINDVVQEFVAGKGNGSVPETAGS